MIAISVPKHLEQRIAHLIKKELAWHDSVTPEVRDTFFGPLTDERTTVLIGIPDSHILDGRSESHHSRAVA